MNSGIDHILDKWRGLIKSKKRMIISLEEIMENKIASLKPWIHPDREPLEGWTRRHFRYDRHRQRTWTEDEWQPIAVGETWGGPDMSAYFRCEGARIPERFAGQEVALRLYFSGDGLLRVNGEAYHGLDPFRELVFLSEAATGDETFDLEVESYIMWHFGEGTEKRFEASEWVTIDREIDAAYWDLRAAFNLLVTEGIPSDLLAFLRDVLHDATNGIEQECRDPQRVREMALRARKIVRERIYQCDRFGRDGLLHMCGNSHLDLVYLWTHAEYERKIGRTHATALRMMEQYPEYIFSQSQPQMYDRMKALYPELYSQVKERVKEGRWEVLGAFWIEPDCNLISGESMVRQVLHGVRFYREEFGITPRTAWIPDVFGNAWSMPQILVQCGLRYFVTHKMNVWNDTNKWQHHVFWWEGPDGSRIFSTVPPTHFIGTCEPDHINDHWENYSAKAQVPESLYCYGWGDGGGGPDREMIEYIKRYDDFPGVTPTRFSRVEDALENMHALASKRDDIPVINDELYLEEHRGVYTTKGRLKKLNRTCDHLLRQAEMFAVFAGGEYPREALDGAWKTFLTTQFHDSLPGSHTREAYGDILDMLAEVTGTGEQVRDDACRAIAAGIDCSGEGEPLVVFNAQPCERRSIARLPLPDGGAFRVLDAEGNEVPAQLADDLETSQPVLEFAAVVPACGYALYHLVPGTPSAAPTPPCAGNGVLENEHLRVSFNEAGELVSLIDKETGRECIDPNKGGNHFHVFEDMPGTFDAWDIEMHYEDTPIAIDPASLEEGACGPLAASLVIRRRILDSTVTQRVVLERGARRVEFRTHIDWKERHKLLKVRFHTTIRSRHATYDIPFANIERPTTRNNSYEEAKFEVCGHHWMDLSQPDFGLSLLTDSKYGYEAHDQMIGLTLLKGPMYPDPESDLEDHFFTYALQPHAGTWREAGTHAAASDLNDPLHVLRTAPGPGKGPRCHSFLQLDAPGVALEALKRAEDGEAMIVRLVERHGTDATAVLRLASPPSSAAACNLLEDEGEAIAVEADGSIPVRLSPYRIQTLKLG